MSENMFVPLDDSATTYLKTISTNFNNQGKTFGEPWPPLSPATIADKKRLVLKGRAISATRPLVRTGKLKTGFGRVVNRNNEAYIYNAQSYALIHNEGGSTSYKGRTVTIPKRVLAEVDNERINIVADIFSKWFDMIVKKNTL